MVANIAGSAEPATSAIATTSSGRLRIVSSATAMPTTVVAPATPTTVHSKSLGMAFAVVSSEARIGPKPPAIARPGQLRWIWTGVLAIFSTSRNAMVATATLARSARATGFGNASCNSSTATCRPCRSASPAPRNVTHTIRYCDSSSAQMNERLKA